jgi:hypothetical protein
MTNWPIVLHGPWWASGIQFFLEKWHELTQVCPLGEDMRPFQIMWKPVWVLTLISIIRDGVQELVSPSDYVMWNYKKNKKIS